MLKIKKKLAVLLAVTMLLSGFSANTTGTAYAAEPESKSETVEELSTEESSTEETSTEEISTEELSTEELTTEDAGFTETVIEGTEETTEAAGEETAEEVEEEAELEQYNATKTVNLGTFNSVKDSSITLESIYKKGGNYAKCTNKESAEKEETDYFYKLAYVNTVGSFMTTGFYDSNGNHHGATHYIKKYYRDVYSQVYYYTASDGTYYYFTYVYYKDDSYQKDSSEDILTYCIQYGEPIDSSSSEYYKEKETYDSLDSDEKYKIAAAIYCGVHIVGSDGNYTAYFSKDTKLSSINDSAKYYNPSTWGKQIWKRYIATQLYIWTVTGGLGDAAARATAKKLDNEISSNSSCLDFYKEIRDYAKSAGEVPSFMSTDAANAPIITAYDGDKDGIYKTTVTDNNSLLSFNAKGEVDNITVSNIPTSPETKIELTQGSSAKKLKISINQELPAKTVLLTWTGENAPASDGKMYFISSSSQQDMVVASATGTTINAYAYLQTQTDQSLSVYKYGLYDEGETGTIQTQDAIEGVTFAVFTTSKEAAVYNTAYDSSEASIAGYMYQELVDASSFNDKTAYYYVDEQGTTHGSGVWQFTQDPNVLNDTTKRAHTAYNVMYGAGSSTSSYYITTGSNGIATAENLLVYNSNGNEVSYYFVETSTPTGVQMVTSSDSASNGTITSGTKTYTAEVNSSGKINFGYTSAKWNTSNDIDPQQSVYNLEKGSVSLYKYDDSTGTKVGLSGVVFKLYSDVDLQNCVATLTTDENGEASAGNLPIGTYYLVETTSQSSYVVSSTIWDVKINPGETTAVNISNTPVTFNFHMTKSGDDSVLADGTDTSIYSVEGAEYTIYAGETIYGANYVPATASSSAQVLYAKDAEVYTMVCDADGNASVDAAFAKANLRAGLYYIKETKAPEGFLIDETVYYIDCSTKSAYSIAADGTKTDMKVSFATNTDTNTDEYSLVADSYTVSFDVVESYETNRIKILKKGENPKDAENPDALAGSVWSVYDLNRMEADGITISDEAFPDFDFTDSKYDSYRTVISSNADSPYTIETDENGEAETTAMLNSTYAVVEVSAPSTYWTVENKKVVLPDDAEEGIVYINAEDKVKRGSIKVMKLGDAPTGFTEVETNYGVINRLVYEKKPLSGVEFTVYDSENVLVGTIITRSDGYATMDELPLGTYYVTETRTPAGLVQDITVYEVKIMEGEDGAVIDAELSVNNDVMSAELAVYKIGETIEAKTDSDFLIGKQPLEGVIYGVYNADALLDTDGNVILAADSLLGVAKTDETGEAVIKECLVPGNYYFKEVQALEGYVIDEEPHAFVLTLSTNAQTERVELNKESPVLNQYYKARIELVKIDANNPETTLTGAKFGLYDAETDEQIGMYITDEDGRISIEEMPYGSYYFMELEAPDGYVLTEIEYDFEVTEDDENGVIQITAVNTPAPKLGFDDDSSNVLPMLLFASGAAIAAAGIYVSLRRKKMIACEKGSAESGVDKQ